MSGLWFVFVVLVLILLIVNLPPWFDKSLNKNKKRK